MKKIGNWLATHWKELIIYTAICCAILFLVSFKLNSLLPGFSQAEISTVHHSQSLQSIIDNPIGAPYKFLLLITTSLLPNNYGIRASSVLLGVVCVAAFYYIFRSWYTPKIAFMSTLVLLTSAWYLHIIRSGTDSSMYLIAFGLIPSAVWLHNSKGSLGSFIVSFLLAISLLYTPGLFWLLLPVLVWQRKSIYKYLQSRNVLFSAILSLLAVASLSPLVMLFYNHPEMIKNYVGLPQNIPTLHQYMNNFIATISSLFIKGPDSPEKWLGSVAYLNIFSTVMFVIGLYAYFRNRKLLRSKFIVISIIFSVIITSFGGPVDISISIPFVYIVVGSGIALMIQQWQTVFPKNPFAKSVGTVLMSAVIALSAYQGLRHFFVAWPSTPETKNVYRQSLN